MKGQGGGGVTDPVVWGRMSSPGVSAGAAPATRCGSTASTPKSGTFPNAIPSGFTSTIQLASSTFTQLKKWMRKRMERAGKRPGCCSRSKAPSRAGCWRGSGSDRNPHVS